MSKHLKLQILGAAAVLALSGATLPALAATTADSASATPQKAAKTTDGSLRVAMNSKRRQFRLRRHHQKAFVPKAQVYTSGRNNASAAAADGDNGVQDFKDFLNGLCPWGQPNC